METTSKTMSSLTLSKKVAILLTIPLAASIAGNLFFARFLSLTSADGHFINVAGRQRMLAISLKDWAHMVAVGQEGDRNGLRRRIAEFEGALAVIEHGGTLLGDRVPPPPPELRRHVAAITGLWRELEPDLLVVAVSPRGDRRFMESYRRLEPKLDDLHDRSHRLVAAFSASRNRLRERMTSVLGALVGVTGLIFLFGVLLTRRYIVGPVLEIGEAAKRIGSGDFSRVLEVPSHDELSDLAVAFNEMTSKVRSLLEKERLALERVKLQSAAIDATDRPVVITDREGRILFVNEAFHRQNGYAAAEVVGKNPRILKSGLTDKAVYPEMWKTLCLGKTWNGEVINRRKDGSVYPAALTISPVCDEAGRIGYFVGSHFDLTERLETETRLRQAQKMEAVGRLAGGVAHDFNNLLTAILGYSAILLETFGSDDPRKTDVVEIKAAGERAASLTGQLLAFSRKQTVSPRLMDVNAVVRGLERMLRRLIEENVDLRVALHGERLPVKADMGQLEQVLVNLTVNARDAMPAGGTLSIETAPVESEKPLVHRHGTIPPGSYAALRVRDTGSGMSEEVQSHLFEPFFTTKEPGKGTGLGLSTIHGIAAQNGGHIVVDSAPGRGSAFTLYLPLASGPVEETPSLEAREIPPGSGTILVLEDDAAVLRFVQRILERNGFSVVAATDPLEAIAVASRKGPFRLLLADAVLPKMGGWEAACRIREEHPQLKVLFMTGYDHRGIQPSIQKPLEQTAFLLKVHEVLASKDP